MRFFCLSVFLFLACSIHSICSLTNASTFFCEKPKGADTCTSPFLTMRMDSLLVRLYVTCIAISTKIMKMCYLCMLQNDNGMKNNFFLPSAFITFVLITENGDCHQNQS